MAAISGLTEETGKYVRTHGEPYSIAYMSDLHQGSANSNQDDITDAFAWIASYDPKPVACIFAGDLDVGERIAAGVPDEPADAFGDFLTQAGWDDDIVVLPVIGNHDTKYAISQSGYCFGSGERPHEYIKSRYPNRFRVTGGGLAPEWYKWDYRDLRVMVMCNLVDTTGNHYHNCNPPGATGLGVANPDYSGFCTPGSTQYEWVKTTSSGWKGQWLVGALHRPIYSAFSINDTGSISRPSLAIARTGCIRDAIYNGMSILLQGDQHVLFGGKKYINSGSSIQTSGISVVADTGGVGAYSFVVPGGFVGRAIDTGFLPGPTPGTHFLFASGWEAAANNGSCVVGMFTFNGPVCNAHFMKFIETGGDLIERVPIYSGYLWRNPGRDR